MSSTLTSPTGAGVRRQEAGIRDKRQRFAWLLNSCRLLPDLLLDGSLTIEFATCGRGVVVTRRLAMASPPVRFRSAAIPLCVGKSGHPATLGTSRSLTSNPAAQTWDASIRMRDEGVVMRRIQCWYWSTTVNRDVAGSIPASAACPSACGVAATRLPSKQKSAARFRPPVLALGVVVARLALNQSDAVRFGEGLLGL